MKQLNIKNILIGLSYFTLHSVAQGQVVYSFAETTNGNVVATLSGSFDTNGLTLLTDGINVIDTTPNFVVGNRSQLAATDEVNQQYDVYDLGQNFDSGLGVLPGGVQSVDPDSHTLSFSFGYANQYLLIGGGLANNAIFNPTGAVFGTMTWNGVSLNDMGLGHLTTTPQVVYQNNDTISFVTVPEPSSSMILGLGTMLFTLKRRR